LAIESLPITVVFLESFYLPAMSRKFPVSPHRQVYRPFSYLGLSLILILILAGCNLTRPNRQWIQAEDGLPRQLMVVALAADPDQPETIWAGIYGLEGLIVSYDGGDTWQEEPVGFTGNPVFDLVYSSQTLWAATRDGLFYLGDVGQTWHRIEELPETAVFAITVDASGRLYAGLDNQGIWRREETGWEPVNGEAEVFSGAGVLSLAVSPDGQQLFAGTAGRGIFASRDAGQSWVQTYPAAYAANISINPADPNVAIAGLRHRLVRTKDGGQSWHTLPLDWPKNQVVSLLWLPDGTLGAGTSQGELYRSIDGGDSWQGGVVELPPTGILSMLADKSGRLLAGTWTGLYTSNDQGQSWTRLASNLGMVDPQALLQTGQSLLLGTRTGIYHWDEVAGHWVSLTGQTPSGAQSLAQVESGEVMWYAGTSSDGLYRSSDGGEQWQPLPTLLKGVSAVEVDPLDPDQIYYLAAWERVYESKDGGLTWQARWEGLGEVVETISLAVDPAGEIAYVGTEMGLYRSSGGQPWELVTPELADQSILVLSARPTAGFSGGDAELLIGTTRGIYRSLDRGESLDSRTWGNELENISVTAILTNPKARRHLVAGTAYNGIYESFDNGRSWLPTGPPELNSGVVESLAWGPEGELFVAATTGVWRTITK
jgi:ligand-binding sensor domain-containing protein